MYVSAPSVRIKKALTIANLSERRPSFVTGDIVKAKNPWANGENAKIMYEAVIHKMLFNPIVLKFDANFQQKYNGEDYRLEFYFSRMAIVNSTTPSQRRTQLDIQLNDEENLLSDSCQCKWHNCILNSIQKKAVANTLRGQVYNTSYWRAFCKFLNLIPSAHLLVGTPYNSSADIITTCLIESDIFKMGEFERLVFQSLAEKELIPEHLMDIGIDGTCKDDRIVTESGLKLKCQMKYSGRYRVTIGTCATLGNFLQILASAQKLTLWLLLLKCQKERGQVILVGDPHQLQAVIINRYARERGFSLSFLERILSRAPYLRNVDSLPLHVVLILVWLQNYSTFTGHCPLDTNTKHKQQTPNRPKTHGIFSCEICGENMQEKDSPSWYNPYEAKNIFLMTVKLYRNNLNLNPLAS
ncbi:hypothetical protein GQX74_013736 [Glossina fuscipes]|nr:hypothetical protein GQX74_013736 [Glossina fuscipes]